MQGLAAVSLAQLVPVAMQVPRALGLALIGIRHLSLVLHTSTQER